MCLLLQAIQVTAEVLLRCLCESPIVLEHVGLAELLHVLIPPWYAPRAGTYYGFVAHSQCILLSQSLYFARSQLHHRYSKDTLN